MAIVTWADWRELQSRRYWESLPRTYGKFRWIGDTTMRELFGD